MAMEARLSLRQSQRVVMTPLLQQAIQLLQLSTLELQEVVQKELQENPLLEEAPPDDAAGPRGGRRADARRRRAVEPAPESPRRPSERQSRTDLPFDLSAVIFGDAARSAPWSSRRSARSCRSRTSSARPTSLTDHLDEQLRLTVVEDPTCAPLGEEIIGNLDEDGYLRADARARSPSSVQLPLDGRREGADPRAGLRPPGRGGARPSRSACSSSSSADRRAPTRVGRDRRAALRDLQPPQVPGHRPGAQAARWTA